MKVAVIFGGKSPEHDVSVLTGLSVMKNLSFKFEIVPIYVTNEGDWLTSSHFRKNSTFETKVKGKICYFCPNDPSLYVKHRLTTEKIKIDCAILCLHGGIGEGGGVQGVLEMSGIAYTSCGIKASSLCLSKSLTKLICKSLDIPILPFVCAKTSEILATFSKSELDYPLMVKPDCGGSSIGITKVEDELKLPLAINLAGQFDRNIIIEPALTNFRELSVAVLVGEKIEISNVEEIVCDGFYSFDNKYEKTTKRIVPATINDDLLAKIKHIVAKFCNYVDIFGCVRFDFLFSDTLYLNEVNTIPGNFAFYLWDKSYMRLLSEMVENAICRKKQNDKLVTTLHTNLLNNLDKIQKITKK